MVKVVIFIIHWCNKWWIPCLSLWHNLFCDIHIENPNIQSVYVIVFVWVCILLRRTIIGAAFQQQSAFIQVTEFGYADEIVVHSRNLPLSGLPSGTCRRPRQWQGLGHQIKRKAPFMNEGVSAACTGVPTGMWFTSTRSRKVQPLCLHQEQSERRDRRATNSRLKYQNTAAQVSQSIFISRFSNTFFWKAKANCSKPALFVTLLPFVLFERFPWIWIFCFICFLCSVSLSSRSKATVCSEADTTANSKSSWWCIWSRWHKNLVMEMISRSLICSFNEPSF